jgi:hypothetical protein
MATKEMPITIAPTKTYCRRRPHFERVLSEMKPMIGSVSESNTRGRKNSTPHIQPGKPMSCTSTTMKMPSAAGNIWLASMPSPKATLWRNGTLWPAGVAGAALGVVEVMPGAPGRAGDQASAR